MVVAFGMNDGSLEFPGIHTWNMVKLWRGYALKMRNGLIYKPQCLQMRMWLDCRFSGRLSASSLGLKSGVAVGYETVHKYLLSNKRYYDIPATIKPSKRLPGDFMRR